MISVLSVAAVGVAYAEEPVQDLLPFPVLAPAAIESTAIGFDQPVSALRQDVRVDIHSRGGPERQADVTVRGGIFESTGFQLGNLTLLDPQTGHYSAELPVDPAFLSGPFLYLGADNAARGFNASLATVRYEWAPIEAGGRVSGGIGSDEHRQVGVMAGVRLADSPWGDGWYGQVSASLAKGDGSVPRGDYEFERYSGRIQHRGERSQTDFFAGYMDKFYGWPGLYTTVRSLNETDHYQVTLLGFQHAQEADNGSLWEFGGFWRRLVDDYQFNRDQPNTFFQHETRVGGLQANGSLPLSEAQRIQLSGTLMADEISRSTSLVHGHFNSRTYTRLSAAYEQDWLLSSTLSAQGLAGLAVDRSNRDGSNVSPFLRMQLDQTGNGRHWQLYVEATEATQLPGYTALNSAPQGAFGGNPDLGRERARTLEAGWSTAVGPAALRVVGFRRWDDALVDWTFSSDQPGFRQANAVDLDVWGFEALVDYRVRGSILSVGYAWLDKSPDYGSAAVDASYYALNYARHRITFSGRVPLHERFSVQLDAEWRLQAANSLRQGSDRGFAVNAGLNWVLDAAEQWEWSLVAENLTNDNFEYYPGVRASRRHWTTQLSRRF
ncbi:MAG: hypothetical protein JJU20_13000 [Opitutales bacterium]|nr:hypothetical protein [Opitutales bacterium]